MNLDFQFFGEGIEDAERQLYAATNAPTKMISSSTQDAQRYSMGAQNLPARLAQPITSRIKQAQRTWSTGKKIAVASGVLLLGYYLVK